MKVLGICGSLQASSSNLSLLRRAAELAPTGMKFSIYDGIRELPLFNPDLEGEGAGAPTAVTSFRGALKGCDALLIACPEYGFSLPGALKNAIDWVIGSGELERKLIAVTASTAAAERGVRGLKALCDTLGAVRARIIGGDPIVRGPTFDEELSVLLEVLQERAVQREGAAQQ
jgi:NAD(P)H-dependent FMN reductase